MMTAESSMLQCSILRRVTVWLLLGPPTPEAGRGLLRAIASVPLPSRHQAAAIASKGTPFVEGGRVTNRRMHHVCGCPPLH